MLVDVTIINDRDPVPAGFSILDTTFDTRMYSIYIERSKKNQILSFSFSTHLINLHD